MRMATREEVLQALGAVKYPGYSRDIVSFGLIKEVETGEGVVRVVIELTTADQRVPAEIDVEVRRALGALPGVKEVQVDLKVTAPAVPPAAAGGKAASLPGVRHIVAVASGKGGVGKSTVAANLAVALSKSGWKVGLLDCDLYGPSMGLMFGTGKTRPEVLDSDQLVPLQRHGVKLMSMGFLVDDDAPVILRGPLVTRYTIQFLQQVDWGDLDLLLLDLPPGTGDIQLTLVQNVALSGAVIVTTPQEVALIDARKALKMFEKVNVPILGIVENMSYFLCPDNGKRYPIFGEGGGRREAQRWNVRLLGEIPLEAAAREAGDEGVPVCLRKPESETAKVFQSISVLLQAALER
jgi:ATP-binding protein involved in chromosome partitioning